MVPSTAPPTRRCSCGLYARHDPPFVPGAGWVLGAVVAWGRLEVHHDGFRAEQARVVAFAAPEAHDEPLDALAAAYGVRVVPPAGLVEYASEFGETLPLESIPTTAAALLTSAVSASRDAAALRPTAVADQRLVKVTGSLLATPQVQSAVDGDPARVLRHALLAAASAVRAGAPASAVARFEGLERVRPVANWTTAVTLDLAPAGPSADVTPLVDLTTDAAIRSLGSTIKAALAADPSGTSGLPVSSAWDAIALAGGAGDRLCGRDVPRRWSRLPRQAVAPDPDDEPGPPALLRAASRLYDEEESAAATDEACRLALASAPEIRGAAWWVLSRSPIIRRVVDLDLLRSIVRDPAIDTQSRVLLLGTSRTVDADLSQRVWFGSIGPARAAIVLRGCGPAATRLAHNALDGVTPTSPQSDLARAAGAMLWLGRDSREAYAAASRMAGDDRWPLLLRAIAVSTARRLFDQVPEDDPERDRLDIRPDQWSGPWVHLDDVERRLWGPPRMSGA